MSKKNEIGAENAPLIGLAPLMRRAFAGEDLTPLGQTLLERAQTYPNDAHAYMDFSTVLQLTGNRDDALAVQAEAIILQQLYSLPANREHGRVAGQPAVAGAVGGLRQRLAAAGDQPAGAHPPAVA
ncbi:hypothetical protein [Duganella radicis]|uniref:hypothetical protein n=1 Tax=Duganella radicis TaxID=551988 RepID=UPI001BAC0EF4|nr:hypothetical protein [Duganella radicis]